MLIAREAQKDAKGFSDLIDYFALVASGVVLTKTGKFIAGWEIFGPDMDVLPAAECWQIASRLERRLRLGSGWSVECNLIRAKHVEYCGESQWPDPVSYLIEQERKARFLMDGEAATRASRYFLTLVFEPCLRGGKRAASWLVSSPEVNDLNQANEKSLALFQKRVAEIDTLLKSNLSQVRRLESFERRLGHGMQTCDELLQVIRQCVSTENYLFPLPETPVFLDQYLATDDVTGGAKPHLGDPTDVINPGKYITVLAIDAFPEKSFAGILRELDSVPFDFRYCQQAQLLDEQSAKETHEANKSKWGFKKSSPLKKLSPIKVGADLVEDDFAAEMEADSRQAANAAEHGKESFAKFTAKIIVMETDPVRQKLACEEIIRVVKYHCGFGCRTETINVVAAWLASFPGQQHKDPRHFLVNTANMVHMMPISAPFRGHRFNPSPYFPPQSPPLLYGVTSGGTPYRFNPWVGDVGHTLLLGPIGGGKTTFLATVIAQFFRYPGAQVFCFDKKRTLYTLCQAMGGDFYDLSPDTQSTGLCPLQDLSTETLREWAAQWIELLLAQNDIKVTHVLRNQIQDTILRMSHFPGDRSLNAFHMAVPAREIKEALQFYVGGILDGEEDTISMSRFCVFEMDELYRLDPKTMNGALFYIFGRIQRRLNSAVPTLVTVDEFREALVHPVAAKAFDDFLFEGRKSNMAVWLVLQELSKALASPLKNAILQQCFTKICLPSPQAILEGASDYEAIGMNVLDRELIAHATPKSDYYVTSPDGKRMISLELGQVALSFLAASGDKERAQVDRLKKQYGAAWPGAWLRFRGLPDWADEFDSLVAAEEAAVAYA